ncbi:MAG: helix-turn-helix domain-containing protein [Anaerolineae bacterium]|nr:helix-turn-helix domain-containing protein [Anaerolineae bacterium]
MSLGDELRYLRAFHGGLTHQEIEQALELPAGTLWSIEQRYRRVGEDDAVLGRLADYYQVPLAELQFHRERYRKALSAVLHRSQTQQEAWAYQVRTGETLRGVVKWWDLGSFGLETEDGLIVVQRHAVVDWEETA